MGIRLNIPLPGPFTWSPKRGPKGPGVAETLAEMREERQRRYDERQTRTQTSKGALREERISHYRNLRDHLYTQAEKALEKAEQAERKGKHPLAKLCEKEAVWARTKGDKYNRKLQEALQTPSD